MFVHGFELFFVVLHERWVQDEFFSPYELFVGLLPVHRFLEGAFIYVKLSTNSTEQKIIIMITGLITLSVLLEADSWRIRSM